MNPAMEYAELFMVLLVLVVIGGAVATAAGVALGMLMDWLQREEETLL